MRNTFRSSCLAAAALSVVVAGSGLAAPVRAQTREATRLKLGAVNVLRGDETGYVRVRVPRPASIDVVTRPRRAEGPTSDVDLSGDRAVAVVLVPDPVPEAPMASEGFFVAGSFEECFTSDCDTERRTNYNFPGRYPQSSGPDRLEIPAGKYRLYLVTDTDVAAEARIRLDGLRGKTWSTPGRHSPFDLKTPQERLVFDQAGSMYAAGDYYYSGAGTGIIVTTLFARADKETDWQFGLCGYQEDPPPPEVAYGPQCNALGDGAGAIAYVGGARALSITGLFDFTSRSRDEQGYGAWISTVDTIEKAGAHAFFVVFG